MTIPQQPIRFATASDGLRIAYTVLGAGDGPPIVFPPGWISHLELESHGVSGAFTHDLAQRRTVVMYDGRGTGLSDREVSDLSIPARLKDLEAVVDHAGLEQFTLFGWSLNSPVAMVYAAEHRERIANLILYASFARGAEDNEKPVVRALIDLIRAEWGIGARTTLGFIHPDADREEVNESLAFFRAACTGEVAASILHESFFNTDVREFLPRITAPALVLHRRGDKAVGIDMGREVATLLPNARLVVLDGDHHPPYESDDILRAIDEFLGIEPSAAAPAVRSRQAYRGSPVTILFTDMEGSTSLTQRLGDASAQELVRAHDTIVRESLLAHGGSQIKHTGDGIMASFPSASGALESAIDIQRAFARLNQNHADLPIQVRIGLNAGEPVREQDDLFGHAVQLARRVCDKAAPGQILASNVVRELVAGKGFLFADQGESALRGFEDPVRLYEVRWAE
jgi:class 3 adenylate cyclase/pimeloyl-ACP methyl ester carboxylesterase